MQEIACEPRYLPIDLAFVAAATAVNQNPVNRPSPEMVTLPGASILSPDHLAVMTSKYWGAAGVKLTVGFTEAINNDLRDRILAHANSWGKYGNVSFVYSNVDPQVRITRAQSGYWSYLGTDILHIAKSDPTMCLQAFTMNTPDSEFKRVVRHEFGHTCGFPHEHMRKSIIDRIDARKAIQYFRQTQGWSPAMVQSQVLTPLAESSIMGTPDADETSIMAYNLPGIITKDGRAIVGGDDIAPQDAEFIGKIYPITKPDEPPPGPLPSAGKGFDLNLDFEKKHIYVRALPGWSVLRMTLQGTQSMSCDNAQLVTLANQLELEVIPAGSEDREAAKQSALGGLFGAILELAAAMKSGDWVRIGVAFKRLLNIVIPDESGAEGGINFAPQAARFKINWERLIAILGELLPLILGAGA